MSPEERACSIQADEVLPAVQLGLRRRLLLPLLFVRILLLVYLFLFVLLVQLVLLPAPSGRFGGGPGGQGRCPPSPPFPRHAPHPPILDCTARHRRLVPKTAGGCSEGGEAALAAARVPGAAALRLCIDVAFDTAMSAKEVRRWVL